MTADLSGPKSGRPETKGEIVAKLLTARLKRNGDRK